MPVGYPNTIDDVWSRVDRSVEGCWLWTGAFNSRPDRPIGYGTITIRRKQLNTHRVAYESAIGPIPDGMMVCHTCDNRLCCRPSHLWLGTNRDNQLDAVSKGTGGLPNRGQFKPKVAPEQRLEVIRRFRSGESRSAIAGAFGVTPGAISWIVKYRS